MPAFAVEFTSRYGPAGPPSWLRSCHGPCDAMGWYPVNEHDRHLTTREAAIVASRIKAKGREEDGWYCVPCPDCHGTGRVSWVVTVIRVPRWLVRGVQCMWMFRPSQSMHVPEWGWWRRVWIAFKVAFLCDLGIRP